MATETRTHLTDDDVGKHVVDASGNDVGMITSIENDHALVDPDPSIMDGIKSTLGWNDDEDSYPIDGSRVETITDDEVRLKKF